MTYKGKRKVQVRVYTVRKMADAEEGAATPNQRQGQNQQPNQRQGQNQQNQQQQNQGAAGQ